ncbi:MAG: DUF3858 domain-containing protein [Candidatus Electryonea clarkiae]|nr:DUF3858 domain-containing protein [Candidatus Electryonea clarkiae]MDP8285367.1 DUF3858 domain-containing protein [Candidatus Electryonea clarkiae]
MRHLRLHIILAVIIISAGSFSTLTAEPMSLSGMQDIGELMTIAEQTFNMQEEDAVILFKGEKHLWLSDKRLKTVHHEIVWISTEWAIRSYADLRVPFDKEHCNMTDIELRTWRENQWWVSGETAKVETLPFAVRNADNYTNMREMMLLHDGIQLPCIMETVYVIEDKKPFRDGAEGVWIFQQDDPAVSVWFGLGVPKGKKANVFKSEGVADGENVELSEKDIDFNIYKMGPLEALGRPHISDPAVESPYISWSTWKNWKSFGKSFMKNYDGAMMVDDVLKDSISSILEDDPIDILKAKTVAEFVKIHTNHTHYNWKYWLENPRNASETFSTAYGHSFDRAILAGALFKEAGLEVNPVFRSKNYTDVNDGIPTFARYDDISLWVSGDGIEAYYNPTSGELTNGLGAIFGRTIWLPGSGDDPVVRWSGKGERSSLSVKMELKFDHEEDNWKAKGIYTGTGGLCPYEDMEGAGTEASDYLNGIISGVLTDAKVAEYNPVVFDRFKVTAGFTADMPQPEPDEFDRIRINFGDPAGGLMDNMPHDLHLYEENRSSPVYLPGNMQQSIRVSMDDSEEHTLILPGNKEITNDAGSFKLTIEKSGKKVTITREIQLNKTVYAPEEWKMLRELLLAEKHERNRSIFIKM